LYIFEHQKLQETLQEELLRASLKHFRHIWLLKL